MQQTPPEETQPTKVEKVGSPGELLLEQLISSAFGGSLSVYGGRMTLEIPANSLTADANIGIRVLSEQDIPEDARGLSTLGDVYYLEPDGIQFDEPVTLKIALDSEEVNGLGVPDGHYPIFLVFIRDTDGLWDLPESVTTEIDLQTGIVSVIAEIPHFSQVYLTSSSWGVSGDIVPDTIDTLVGLAWTPRISVSNNGTDADYVILDPIYYEAGPDTIVKVEGNSEGDAINVYGGKTEILKPKASYICIDEGEGWYGAIIGVRLPTGLIDEMYPFLNFGSGESENNNIDFTIRVTGDCTCVNPPPPPPPPPPPTPPTPTVN